MEYYLDNDQTWVIKNALLRLRHEIIQNIESIKQFEPYRNVEKLLKDKKDIEDVLETMGFAYCKE